MKPRGRIDSVAAALDDAAGALRRRREARRPYAKVYDEDGFARLLPPDSPLAEALLDAAEDLVEAGMAAAQSRAAERFER